MSLVELRQSIKDTIESEVEGFAEVYLHGGRFDEAELKRWAVKAPSAVVGMLGIPSMDYDTGQLAAKVEWGVFIITKDTVDMKRDAAALVLVEALLGVVRPEQRWNDDAAHMPEQIKAQNLYHGTLDSKGVAIWAVTWTQSYDVNVFDWTKLDDFLTFNSVISVEDSELDDTPTSTDNVVLDGAGDDN